MRPAVLILAVTLSLGCAWFGSDEEGDAEGETASEPASNQAGVCRRKGRLWPEGSRVCEDHAVRRCFADGEWHVIGSC